MKFKITGGETFVDFCSGVGIFGEVDHSNNVAIKVFDKRSEFFRTGQRGEHDVHVRRVFEHLCQLRLDLVLFRRIGRVLTHEKKDGSRVSAADFGVLLAGSLAQDFRPHFRQSVGNAPFAVADLQVGNAAGKIGSVGRSVQGEKRSAVLAGRDFHPASAQLDVHGGGQSAASANLISFVLFITQNLSETLTRPIPFATRCHWRR